MFHEWNKITCESAFSTKHWKCQKPQKVDMKVEESILLIKFIEDEGAVKFTCIKLPTRISFAMTINKSPCQALKRISLVLDEDTIFSHMGSFIKS